MKVLVAGASGTTGSQVVGELVEAGVPVRAMTRSAETAESLRRLGVEPVVAAYDDPESLRAALDGIDADYLVSPSNEQMPATERAFAQAAADAGVHLVKLSVIGAATDSSLRLARMHAHSEAAIEAVGGDWTFLQPNGFMQNDLAWAAQLPSGTIVGPVMDAAWSIVDTRDVAAVAAAVLTDPSAQTSKRIVVTGPEPRTPRDRVRALAEILGREIEVVDVPIPTVVEQLRDYGMTPWYADGLGELFGLDAAGLGEGVAPDAASLLGRPTRRWEDFVTDHRDAFNG